MTVITLDGTGKSKAALVEMAYEQCGLNGAEFERTAEEMTTGLRHLNALMAEMLADGIGLGFDFPTYADGKLDEPSGIPDSAVSVVTSLLAQRIAPAGSYTLSPDARAVLNRSYNSLQSRFATIPVRVPLGSPVGAGYKGRLGRVVIESTDDPGDLAAIIGS